MTNNEELEEMEYIDLNEPEDEEEVNFMIWKAEINKELKSFWKEVLK